MSNNLNAFTAQGSRYTFWATWFSSYIYGTSSAALTAGNDSGMGRLKAMQTVTTAIPEAPSVDQSGDNGVVATFITSPPTGPTGGFALGAFDQTFDTTATQTTIYAVGPHDIHLVSNKCYNFLPLFIVVNSPAASQESATLGEAGWQVTEYLYAFAQPLSVASQAINAPQVYSHRLVFNERGVLPWGETITDAHLGATQGWQVGPYWSAYPVYYHTYVGTGGAAQTFTLDNAPYADDGTALQIWDNGTALEHTTNYSVSTTTGVVTFVDTDPASAHVAVAKVMFNPSC